MKSVFFGATAKKKKKKLNINKFDEPHCIPAQGQPGRTFFFQHMKSNHKAGKRRKCVSTATSARQKSWIHPLNQEKHTLTNHKVEVNGVGVNAFSNTNTYRKQVMNLVNLMKHIPSKHKEGRI